MKKENLDAIKALAGKWVSLQEIKTAAKRSLTQQGLIDLCKEQGWGLDWRTPTTSKQGGRREFLIFLY